MEIAILILKHHMKQFLLLLSLVLPFLVYGQVNDLKKSDQLEFDYFTTLVEGNDPVKIDKSFDYLNRTYKSNYNIMLLELMYLNPNNDISIRAARLLASKTRKPYGFNFNKWYEFLWNKKEKLAPYYASFKSLIHQRIDNRFTTYFEGRQDQREIRLDEIRWGGVIQDGIPPLRNPKMLKASEANYLADTDIVFGIEVNGDVRAYPKRILAWHEMFTDTVGDIDVAGVYCTLCGTVILYETKLDGVKYDIGTSGFLYRSNKLMYDQKTQSLWSTLDGKPVVGDLVGKGIQLQYRSVVTTTWGKWKELHPDTKVLSLDTGHRRNYDEGNAYKNYFATDDLMFNVPKRDKSLKNKQSILALKDEPRTTFKLAIDTDYLKKHPVYNDELDGESFVVLTDKSGANRVFFTNGIKFKSLLTDVIVKDENGGLWTVKENELVNHDGGKLKRWSSFNAFWFGWKAAYPDTKLIQ